MNLIRKIGYIIIHHTERNNDFPFFVKFRHKYLRGWEDIGYHYLIGNNHLFTKDGNLYVGREEKFEGAHVIGYNKDSLGICLIGNFDKKAPTKKQFETLFSFLKEKLKKYNLSAENICGHNEFLGVEKSCPRNFVNMNYIRAVASGGEEFSFSKYLSIIKSLKFSPSF